ncbi:MAG: SDR family oxidoreductase [Anaerolineaceae bacterium]|nr:SDR family oxidoreductase [Anaerolineaceae bacterium]
MSGVLEGKVAVVTGANGNVGQAVSRLFAAEGAQVVLVGRNEADVQSLATELKGIAVMADVTDLDSVETAVQKILLEAGQMDILVHTVGGFAMGKPVHESGLDVWDKMMTLNARSLYITAGRVARYMVENNIQGKIVGILARNANKSTAKSAAYSASKAAAQRIIESMALELRGLGINVNAVVPGTIDTPQNREAMPQADFTKWVQPEEIAQAILFLASPNATAISGVSLEIFGRT